MRILPTAAFALALLAASPLFPVASGVARAASIPKDAWPETRAGNLARGWVTAFGSGEDAMRDFLDRNLAPKSLQERNLHTRVERYKALREQYGKLQLTEVVKSTPNELTVKLLDSEAKSHEFTFTAQAEAPFKLLSVSMREKASGLHGMFGGFHH